MHEHATKPATLRAGLSDSPAGLAAWIAEKIVAWSSSGPDGTPALDRDLLLATLTRSGQFATKPDPPHYSHKPLQAEAPL